MNLLEAYDKYFNTCTTCGKKRKDNFLYECDICGVGICTDHSRFTRHLSNEAWGYAYQSENVQIVCFECAALKEKELIHFCPVEDLPTLMGIKFGTDEAREYLLFRLSTGKTRKDFYGNLPSKIVYLKSMILAEEAKRRKKAMFMTATRRGTIRREREGGTITS